MAGIIAPPATTTLTGADSYSDALTGSSGADRILGLSGNDALDGSADDDIIEGGLGVSVRHCKSRKQNISINQHVIGAYN